MRGYAPRALPFRSRRLPDGSCVAVSDTGDHVFLDATELAQLQGSPHDLPLHRQALLKSLFFLRSAQHQPGVDLLRRSRQAARRATVADAPSLHIIVPTLQCAHTCQYCQVSRSLADDGHAMTVDDIEAACDSVFNSPARTLTVEFQGGDPLLRFDLLHRAISRIAARNQQECRSIRFVVASTLHQLTEDMCGFFKEHAVFLSTSIDGPAQLHNRNRPLPTRDSYERTVEGIKLAREKLGAASVSALMTATLASLRYPKEIVDTYIELGLDEIFLRPLNLYGFAKKNGGLGYSVPEFMAFYQAAIDRVVSRNFDGVPLREFYASIILNKLISPFDLGYVDLQSPTGSGRSVLVYNYDGFVYPSDEARMLAEAGDTSFRLGRIGTPLREIKDTRVMQDLQRAGSVETHEACKTCAYNVFCAPNPVDAHAQYGSMFVDPAVTHHSVRHKALFDFWLMRLGRASGAELDLYHRWAQPASQPACAE